MSSRLSVKLSPDLTLSEKALVVDDLYQALQYEISADPGSYFDKVFHGVDTNAVAQYLNERLGYIIPSRVNIEDQLFEASNIQDTSHGGHGQVYTVALNMGVNLWFAALASAPRQLYFEFGDSYILIDSSRVGIVQLGDGYTAQDHGGYVFPSLVRVSTLVHEARHSDCTGGMHQSTLDLLMRAKTPDRLGCGHLHVKCPEGHDYAGYYACDNEAWGAYSVEAVYVSAFIKNCSSCSAADSRIARMIEADALNRVLPLNDMLRGKSGDPDMSSSSGFLK
ncbi:MAG: hypothetical protein P4M08_09960 [Oligoflexia bacterium]|nr:hypothetical protein [Oligoflexia bacterium]